MATRNGSRFIREQIDSILPQLSSQDELIISDDQSDDTTISILKSYRDDRIKLYFNDSLRGISRNFENCLKHCRGEYIFLADQDDVWLPHKIEVMKNYLSTYDLVICDCGIANHKMQLKHNSFFQLNNSGKGLVKNIIKNSYMGCCMGFKRNVLERALPFPSDLPVHDMWLGLIGEIHFRVYFVPERLVFHRRHDQNASTTTRKSNLSLHQKFYNRYRIIRNLLSHKPYAG